MRIAFCLICILTSVLGGVFIATKLSPSAQEEILNRLNKSSPAMAKYFEESLGFENQAPASSPVISALTVALFKARGCKVDPIEGSSEKNRSYLLK